MDGMGIENGEWDDSHLMKCSNHEGIVLLYKNNSIYRDIFTKYLVNQNY